MSESFLTELIHGDAVFTRLKDEWDDLWQSCREASEAQTWAFQQLYRKYVAPSDQILSVTARDAAGRLCGLGIFSIRRDRATLQRRLGFFGEHDVDYHGMLYREGTPETTGRRMMEAVLEAAGSVPVLEILNVPEESWTRRALAEGVSFPGFNGPQTTRQSERFAIPLPATMEDYWATFSKKTRDRLKGKMRKLQREFAVEFRCVSAAAGLDAVLDSVEAVERARWEDGGKFGDPASCRFLRAMITALMREGRCRIFTLHVDGRCVAYITGFLLGSALRIPYLAHDISLPGNHSVGLICNLMAIEHCIGEGLQQYDLTRGSESYKSLLGGELGHNYSVTAFRSAGAARLAGLNRRFLAPLVRSRFARRLRGMAQR